MTFHPDPKISTFRSKGFRDFVAEQPCEISDGNCQGDVVAAHTGRGGERIKASDGSCIPLCFTHHMEQHGGYRTFADKYSLDYQRICMKHMERYIERLERALRRAA